MQPTRRIASVSVVVVAALAACAPSGTDKVAPAPTVAATPSPAGSEKLVALPTLGSTMPPLAPSRPRAPASTKEPLAPVVDYRWDGKLVVAPPRPAGAPDDADPFSARGAGEGGGGRGDGIGLGAIGTLGHGAGASGLTGAGFGSGAGRLSGTHATGSARSRAPAGGFPPPPPDAPGVKSGEWDDDANYLEFQRFLAGSKGASSIDVSARRFLVVRDAEKRAVPNCGVEVTGVGAAGAELGHVTLVTTSTGRAIFFPREELPGSTRFVARADCTGSESAPPVARFDLAAPDAAVTLDLATDRSTALDRTVDVVFVLDTTGSMSEEIAVVTSTIEKVAHVLDKRGLSVRLGLVEYRDRSDAFLARVHPMTRDVAGFVGEVKKVSANGGGDMPEDVDAGLAAALGEEAFHRDSVARLVFLIGDAPPHLDYKGDVSYVASMKRASHEGIQLFTVAASGMDDVGQTVFRQIAMYTGATSLFVLRGGAGPQSVGGGDPRSSCGGTQRVFRTSELDRLISEKVDLAVAALDADPTKIPGLGADELAKPCRATN